MPEGQMMSAYPTHEPHADDEEVRDGRCANVSRYAAINDALTETKEDASIWLGTREQTVGTAHQVIGHQAKPLMHGMIKASEIAPDC